MFYVSSLMLILASDWSFLAGPVFAGLVLVWFGIAHCLTGVELMGYKFLLVLKGKYDFAEGSHFVFIYYLSSSCLVTALFPGLVMFYVLYVVLCTQCLLPIMDLGLLPFYYSVLPVFLGLSVML